MPSSVDAAPARTERRAVASRLWIDLVVAVVLLVGSGVWATRFWNFFVAHGGQPSFYQEYFEPAVMVACGKGFVVASTPQPEALVDFLRLRRDTFDCRDIPPALKLGQENLFQGPWRYLLVTVGWAWRVLGISWSGMGPLFGLLFGVTIALAYGIFRLGMGRPLAAAGAFGLAISSMHLINLPHLRDYAKAPFVLALILILGLLVRWPVSRRTVLGLAAAYGAVLGIGYGFRTDFLVNLPVIVIVLFAFLDGGITRNLALKAAAAALAVAAFIVVSWPVTSSVYSAGGCQWHVALLGLESTFDRELHVTAAPYDFGYAYSDSYVFHTVSSYARRMPPALDRIEYCSHQYDVESGRYLEQLVARFPADFAARAYASTLQVVELPFGWGPPMKGWWVSLYQLRGDLLQRKPVSYLGVLIVAAATVLAGSASLRIAFFLLFFVLYFGGYPAVQFHNRHCFHLELITWWAAGFIVHQTITTLWPLWRKPVWERRDVAVRIGRAAAFIALATALIVGTMRMARWYQVRQVKAMLQAYISAPKRPLPLQGISAGVLQPIPLPAAGDEQPPTWQFVTQFLEVDLNEAACGPAPSVTFRYDKAIPDLDFSRTVTLARRAGATGLTRIFFVAYEHFTGLEFSDATPGCVAGASRFVDLRALPLLLNATITPDWEQRPLYQRLADWELRWQGPAR